jgi:hypothetical protein
VSEKNHPISPVYSPLQGEKGLGNEKGHAGEKAETKIKGQVLRYRERSLRAISIIQV